LSRSLGQFDVVLAANLICRLPEPRRFLREVSQFIKPGGYLVLTSPYSISADYTVRELWFAGYQDKSTGEPVQGFRGVERELSHDFELDTMDNMPFFIRETGRKNQWTVAHCTVWRRKA
jgi:SAM-dependent methyltransferase